MFFNADAIFTYETEPEQRKREDTGDVCGHLQLRLIRYYAINLFTPCFQSAQKELILSEINNYCLFERIMWLLRNPIDLN